MEDYLFHESNNNLYAKTAKFPLKSFINCDSYIVNLNCIWRKFYISFLGSYFYTNIW